MSNFSERLRELRKERKLTQNEMAKICGLKPRGYQEYEYKKVIQQFLAWFSWRTFSASVPTTSWDALTGGNYKSI